MLKVEAAEAAVAATASKTTYAGSGVAAVGWLASNEVISLAGLTIAVLGFAVNVWFKWRADLRAQREHEAVMRGDVKRIVDDTR